VKSHVKEKDSERCPNATLSKPIYSLQITSIMEQQIKCITTGFGISSHTAYARPCLYMLCTVIVTFFYTGEITVVIPFFEIVRVSDTVVSRGTPWTHKNQFITSVLTEYCLIHLFLLKNIPKITYLGVAENIDFNIRRWHSFLNALLEKKRDGLAKKAFSNRLEEYPFICIGIFVWDNDFPYRRCLMHIRGGW
jgi:hypothetical protein